MFLDYGSENNGHSQKAKETVYKLLAKHSPVYGDGAERDKLYFNLVLFAHMDARERASILLP